MILDSDERLKPCPFCNSEAWLGHIEFNDYDTWYNPQCSECGVMWKENFETKEEAIKVWNKRKY
jgi:Lar family restriction alleviation protein